MTDNCAEPDDTAVAGCELDDSRVAGCELDDTALRPAETDLFTYARRELEGDQHVYHDCRLRARIGPVPAGAAARRIAVRLDDGTIAVHTDTLSFFGYVRLHVV